MVKSLKEILQTILESLVIDKSKIEIKEIDNGKEISNTQKEVSFEVRVAQGDMGRVIGKEGRIAKAIRTIFKAVATKEQKKVSIEFID